MSSGRLLLDSSYRELTDRRHLRDTARSNIQPSEAWAKLNVNRIRGTGRGVGLKKKRICLHPLENKFLNRKQAKKRKRKPTSAVNNTVNKLITDRESCDKLYKKFRFADPVFTTSGIYVLLSLSL